MKITAMPDTLLIEEDDNEINHMLTELLRSNGYRSQSAYSGTEALLYLRGQCGEQSTVNERPRAVILDLILPGMTGEELLHNMKEIDNNIPVIVASAKDDVHTRVELLRAGADDYIVKPFDTEELLARLEVALRRSAKTQGVVKPGGMLTFKDIVIEPDEYRVTAAGQEVTLTKREFMILELLMSNPNKVFTKNNIYESVWNEEFVGEDNAVNVHISNIRQKLAKVNGDETYIQTVWGIGFKMCAS